MHDIDKYASNHQYCLYKLAAKSPSADLIVVGGGPSGAMAALLAAEAGLETVLLERSKIPRPKSCGGLISARAANLLPTDLLKQKEVFHPIRSIAVITGKREYIAEHNEPCGYLVDRTEFDSALLMVASARGVKVLDQTALTGINLQAKEGGSSANNLLEVDTSSTGKISARYIIGADGAYSVTARLTGLRKRKRQAEGKASSILIEKICSTPGKASFYPRPFSGGMAWSFRAGCLYNYGSGGLFGRQRDLKKDAELFRSNGHLNYKSSWPLPFLGPVCQNTAGRVILVGDAAGFVEPYSGEGIYNSLKSAYLAIEAIKEAEVNNTEAESYYCNLIKRHFRRLFIPALIGAVYLHALALLVPQTLPREIIKLMNNRLWFNDHLPF